MLARSFGADRYVADHGDIVFYTNAAEEAVAAKAQ